MIAHEAENGIRVAINDEYFFAADSISITLAQKLDANTVRIAKFENGYLTWEVLSVGEAIGKPTFLIPQDFTRPLLDALLKYYQGASDMHQLRQDFLHERERVDKLTSVISNALTKLVEGE